MILTHPKEPERTPPSTRPSAQLETKHHGPDVKAIPAMAVSYGLTQSLPPLQSKSLPYSAPVHGTLRRSSQLLPGRWRLPRFPAWLERQSGPRLRVRMRQRETSR